MYFDSSILTALGLDPARATPGPQEVYLGLFAGVYRAGMTLGGKTVLVLGEGENASVAEQLVKDLGAKEVICRTRTPRGGFPAGEEDARVEYLIYADEPAHEDDHLPLSLDVFPHLEGVVDMTVRPLRTRLLLAAEEKDLLSMGGLFPAVAAAVIRAAATAGATPSPGEMDRAYKTLLLSRANLAVTGLRFDGAEPVAKVLSRLSGRPLVRVPNTPAGIASLSACEGKLLLLEEGIAGKKEALYPAAQNSRIVFVAPPLDTLQENRDTLGEKYRRILPTYSSFCDRTFEYRGDPAATARAIYDSFLSDPYLRRNI